MTDYDTFADAYSRENESSLLNGWYERPAMIKLAGDVADLLSSIDRCTP